MNNLSNTGLEEINATDITTNNITILSSLTVNGENIVNKINGVLSAPTININAVNDINLNVSTVSQCKINTSGLSIFHPNVGDYNAPYAPGEYWNVSQRFDKLYDVMSDNPKRLVCFDAYRNTLLSIRGDDAETQDATKPSNYPKEIRFTDKFGAYTTKINSSGFSFLDNNNNWIKLSDVFKVTGDGLHIGGDRTKLDVQGNLSVFNMTTQNILGVDVTGGTWLSVTDNIMLNTSGISALNTRCSDLSSSVAQIGGTAENIANIAHYYTDAQLSLAFTSGLISDVGLVLAFKLKEDIFDAQYPLQKRSAIPSNGEVKNQLILKYGPSLDMDSNNRLAINTRDFLTPSYGDLGLLPTDTALYPLSSSPSYIVIRKVNNPLTCMSSLNVSGVSMFNNNSTFMSSLYVSGVSTFNNNCTFVSNLNVSGLSTFKNNSTFMSNLNISGTLNCNSVQYASTQLTIGDATFNSKLFISGTSILQASTTILNTLNVSGFTTLNNTTINGALNVTSNIATLGTINVSGTTLLNSNTTISSSLNISGVTKIGSGNVTDSFTVFEVHNNINVRKNYIFGGTNYGDEIFIAAANSATTTQSYLDVKSTGVEIAVLNPTGELFINAYTRILKNLNVQGSIYCQNVMRKQIFNFTCATPINIGSTTYYRYDIDLNRYTASYSRTSGSTVLGTTRKFKWMSWLATGIHENGYDLNYDISCSYKNTTPNLGLSICAYGWPFENKLLSSVNPNGPFLQRNSFDYITFCCSIQNTVITAMIIDYL